MKQLFLTILSLFCIISAVFADGTKQFMPNKNTSGTPEGKGQCYLALGSREGGTAPSRAFARYNHTNGESCPEDDRLYIRIADPVNEKIYLGFGGIKFNEEDISANQTLKYRIKLQVSDDDDIPVDVRPTHPEATDFVVWGGAEGFDVPKTTGPGHIETYAQAYYGPKAVDPDKGYNPIVVTVDRAGLYYLEFDIGSDIGSTCDNCQPIDFELFDVSVVNTVTKKQIDGRIYSRSWGLTTNGPTNAAWATFYTYSTDHYTSKVYLGGVMPFRFVFCCNSFGSINDAGKSVEEKRQSFPNPNNVGRALYLPEYKIFTTTPDVAFYGEPSLPNLPQKLSFAGDAMTCEDLIFVMKLLNKEDATIELYLNETNDDGSQKVLIDVLKSADAEARGYHYPWKDQPEIKNAGYYYYTPVSSGCARQYKLSLFDQRFTGGSKEYNVGDTCAIDYPTATTISWNEPLGSEKNPILISKAEQLTALAEAVNTGGNFTYTIKNMLHKDTPKSYDFVITNTNGFKNVHFYVTAKTGDIVLGSDWEGIGTIDKPFKGTFRCGKYMPDPEAETPAAFVGDQDTITIQGSRPLFNYCDGATIDNIHVKGNITLSEDSYTNISEVAACGGVCSYSKNTTFTHCSNAVELKEADGAASETAIHYTGGIVGWAENCTIDSCSNKGEIHVETSHGATGGIVGYLKNSSRFNFCFNAGLINARNFAGGVIGKTNGNNEITNCKNINSIAAEDYYAGGIICFDDGTTTISDCYNSGTISSAKCSGLSSAGGIVAMIASSSYPTITYCLNTGNVSIQTIGFEEYANGIAAPDDADISYSLSTGTPEIYILSTLATGDPSVSALNNGGEHFFEEDGVIKQLETYCCGSTWRNEEAGRLFKNDTIFYLAWDGKFDNGECVVGEVTVNYQKNTGVTHFPFYDPENIKSGDGKVGLVVYRIAPIEDSLKTGLYPTIYKSLPENYYQTTNLSSTERGIEMSLYWDDRRIAGPKTTCDKTTNNGYTIGEDIHYDAITSDDVAQNYCISWAKNACKVQSKNKIKVLQNGKVVSKYYCTTFNAGKTCSGYAPLVVQDACDSCRGIENVSRGGYMGSLGGGHIFPIETNNGTGYGNNHIINTWWNGIEKKGVNTLHLKAYEPAILMPIIISKWIATNLSQSVLLEWTTSSEENNSYFIVERSINGRDWERIGKVIGAGTSSVEHSYSFEDTKPIAGISYYRLKQTDFNGEYSYSSIKCINRPNETEDYMTVYPNANANSFIVEGISIAACPIEVYDIVGHKITNVSFNTINPSKVAISVEHLPIGTYIVTCCNKSKTIVKNW
ncbi:MAG: T9SS type A sorting domain-containing protein [Bacteroidales bacterium]|nr:T9SS type A sorting domain-containing protein [Bacteroidales bacterium]